MKELNDWYAIKWTSFQVKTIPGVRCLLAQYNNSHINALQTILQTATTTSTTTTSHHNNNDNAEDAASPPLSMNGVPSPTDANANTGNKESLTLLWQTWKFNKVPIG